MGELGLGERLTHRGGSQLSGGERQRVMIARALRDRSGTGAGGRTDRNLDSRRSEEVLRLLRRLSHERRTATILVTHDPLAARFADRVLELHDGRLRPHTPIVASA